MSTTWNPHGISARPSGRGDVPSSTVAYPREQKFSGFGSEQGFVSIKKTASRLGTKISEGRPLPLPLQRKPKHRSTLLD